MLLERGRRGKERERMCVRETSMLETLVASHTPQLGIKPVTYVGARTKLKQQPSGVWDDTPTN